MENIVKHIFLAYFGYNRKMEKSQILDENLGLKQFFFYFLKVTFLLSRKTIFYGEYRQLHFPGLFGIKFKKQ